MEIFRFDKKLKQVILKNMRAHSNRNLKTAMMFSLVLAFLIFSSSFFTLIGQLITLELENGISSDLFMRVIDTRNFPTFIDE